MMDRRGFLKLLGLGAGATAAGLVLPDVEPVRRFWQVGANAPVGAGKYDRMFVTPAARRLAEALDSLDYEEAGGPGLLMEWGKPDVFVPRGTLMARRSDGSSIGPARMYRTISVPDDERTLGLALGKAHPGDTILMQPAHVERWRGILPGLS